MILREGKRHGPQTAPGSGEVGNGPQWLGRYIECWRSATPLSKRHQALARRTIRKGGLLVMDQGNGGCAVSGRSGFHRSDNVVTE